MKKVLLFFLVTLIARWSLTHSVCSHFGSWFHGLSFHDHGKIFLRSH